MSAVPSSAIDAGAPPENVAAYPRMKTWGGTGSW
jgi:hypothetical protein